MTVYVDALEHWGWRMYGRTVQSCHLFTDTLDLSDLYALAKQIGMRRSWFQDKQAAPHYDLTPSRRAAAIAAGAVAVDRCGAVTLWRARRALAAKSFAPGESHEPGNLPGQCTDTLSTP